MNLKQEYTMVGRVISQNRLIYHVVVEGKDKVARVSGKLQYSLQDKEAYPVVGDLVECQESYDELIIQKILPRKSMIARKVAGGRSDGQVLATNIDKVFIVMALNSDFNLRRLERYLLIGWESGAIPIILLTKADLCEDIEDKLNQIEQVAIGVEVRVLSTVTGEGFEALEQSLQSEEIVVFIGSSGVGKSSIVNQLMRETVQLTKGIDEHDKGRHTTTHRELFVLPAGAMIIDTPGMRELQFNQGDVEATFSDIETLSLQCRFSDCKHKTEPGCKIIEAIEEGSLPKERYTSYVKLTRELALQESRRQHKEKIKLKKMKVNR